MTLNTSVVGTVTALIKHIDDWLKTLKGHDVCAFFFIIERHFTVHHLLKTQAIGLEKGIICGLKNCRTQVVRQSEV